MREWFDSEGYSFRRLPKFDDSDIARLAKRLWLQRWRKANPQRNKEYERAAYARARNNPQRWAKLKAVARKAHQRRLKNPAWAAKRRTYNRVARRRQYRELKADPAKRAEYQRILEVARQKSRERYARLKQDATAMERRRAYARNWYHKAKRRQEAKP